MTVRVRTRPNIGVPVGWAYAWAEAAQNNVGMRAVRIVGVHIELGWVVQALSVVGASVNFAWRWRAPC